MDNIINTIMNMAPIIFVLLLGIFLIYIASEKKFFANLFAWGCCVLIGGYPICLILGYGNTIWCIVIQIGFVFLVSKFESYDYLKMKSVIHEPLLAVAFVYTFFSFVCIYIRITYRSILEVKIVSNILCKLKTLDYLQLFFYIMENEWVKGISIGALGTVIGGLMLDKIKKSK